QSFHPRSPGWDRLILKMIVPPRSKLPRQRWLEQVQGREELHWEKSGEKQFQEDACQSRVRKPHNRVHVWKAPARGSIAPPASSLKAQLPQLKLALTARQC